MITRRKNVLRHLLFIWLIITIKVSTAQDKVDTLKISLQASERVFLENNLPLLAEKLNISQADARILQAKAWPNPTFTLDEIQLYNLPTTDESPPLFGNFWRNKTFSASIDQLILTASKRKKNISLQTRNRELAEISFTDLLQALKAEFRQTGAELLYLQRVQEDYAFQLRELNKLVNAQQLQFREGNISQTELFRLKGLQISLQAEINELHEQITDKQQNIKALMNVKPDSFIILTDEAYAATGEVSKLRQYALPDLIALSSTHNAAIGSARKLTEVNEAELKLQLAERVPNINLNVNYDRNGNNQLNFLGAGFSIPLPIFDRNKGNIRAAQIEVKKSELMKQYKESQIGNSIVKTWSDLQKALQLYESIDKDYVDKLQQMSTAVIRNFLQHNISLLEFIDFFESFRQSKEKFYETIKLISLRREDLNYLTGKEL